jgi:hypothetical protein
MSGYLAGYGVGDEKRERRRKRIILASIAVVVLGGLSYALLHNFFEERAAKRFLSDLRSGQYQAAYRMWGCTEQTPCRDYAFDRFMADWGPQGTYRDPNKLSFGPADSCGGGVVMTLEYPEVEPAGLYIDRSTKVLSYAPWPRCPGRHWNFGAFWRSWFGKPEPPPAPGTK